MSETNRRTTMTSDWGDEDIVRLVAELEALSGDELGQLPVGDTMPADGGQRS
jgi:hypothetical protein